MIEDTPALLADTGETIQWGPGLTSITAIVDRHTIDADRSISRKEAVYTATLHAALTDVGVPAQHTPATFDLFEEDGTNPVVWSVVTVGEVAGGLVVLEMEYKATMEVRREGTRRET